jgi:acyl-CoA synthetase (AMP-forming)/AMP-acid ligase II
VAILAGSAAAGVEACLYPPAAADEVHGLLGRFDHDVVATDRDDLDAPQLLRLSDLVGSTTESGSGGDDQEPPSPRPHLVLTTGTTGAPRGVRHDWDRLLRSTRRIKPGADERWLLAYGLHQFAGLQILLHVFAAGATLVAPAPRRPREGLAAMRTLGVTHASATPTYWRFLLAELRSDAGPVPELRQVTMGGEAVPGPLLGEIRRTFPDAYVSQVYAASEFGSTGSMRDGLAGLSTEVLDRSEDADVALKIVDGELWIRSRTGMLGYYGEPEVDADAWRPSGDLVVVEGDRIVFLGRSSEIINVGGVKVHPLTIEERVSAVPGVDVARVYGRKNPMTGQIVALEVVADPGADQQVVDAAIRAACADLPSASRPRSIRFVAEVTTAGSKIVRRTTGEQ